MGSLLLSLLEPARETGAEPAVKGIGGEVLRPRRIDAREENTMARLQDKVVIVTGGAQGLGEGIALRLAEEGASRRDCGHQRRKGPIRRRRSGPGGPTGDRRDARCRGTEANARRGSENRRTFWSARRHVQQRRLQPTASFHGRRRRQLQQHHARERVRRPGRHTGSRPPDDGSGERRQDHQYSVDRRATGICGIRSLLREQGLGNLADSGRRARVRQA